MAKSDKKGTSVEVTKSTKPKKMDYGKVATPVEPKKDKVKKLKKDKVKGPASSKEILAKAAVSISSFSLILSLNYFLEEEGRQWQSALSFYEILSITNHFLLG
jgi:hypothetical protein